MTSSNHGQRRTLTSAAGQPGGHSLGRRVRAAVIAAATLGVAVPPAAWAQVAAPADAPATQPAATQPSTQPAARQVAQNVPPSTRPATRNGNGGARREGAGIALNFQNADINVVLDELSGVAGFKVLREVQPTGRINLTSQQPVGPDEAINLLNTALRSDGLPGGGYVAIQQDGKVLRIVGAAQAKRLNIPVRTGADPTKIAATDELITQVIPLKYADAQTLRQDLQPLINPSADFTSNASSNALVITDTSANVKRVVQIVAALDTSLANSLDVKVFQLKFADAQSAATLINNVFGNLAVSNDSGGGGNNNRGGGNNQGNRGGGNAGGGGFPGGGGFGGGGFGGGFPGGGNFGGGQFGGRFQNQNQQQQGGGNQRNRGPVVTASADTRTNSVVVSGPTDTLTAVAEVIKELDANPAAEESVYVYRLRNSQALNLESTLNALFNGGTPNRTNTQQSQLGSNRVGSNNSSNNRSSRGGTGVGTSGGGFGTNNNANRFGGQATAFGGGQFGGFGNVGGNNRVAGVQGAASDLAGQVSVIADPDTNSLLVRTSPANYPRVKSILDELDRPVGQVLIKVLIAEVTHDNNADYGVEFSVLNTRPSGNGQTGRIGDFNVPVGPNATGLVVSILETNFQAAIRALEQQGKLEVLSRPYILASDNQLASITVGQEVPFITSTRILDDGNTINTIQYDDIGILLDVLPHINPDGLVIMDVAPEISTLTGTTVPISNDVAAPVIAKRSASSRVAVKTGQTIVIGGLMEDRVTNTVNKVPLLGDIPWLGELFRRTQKNKSKTELLIFLTPHVASDPNYLPEMTRQEQEGLKLVPNSIAPGVFDEHMQGMQRGDVPMQQQTEDRLRQRAEDERNNPPTTVPSQGVPPMLERPREGGPGGPQGGRGRFGGGGR
jgi:general secretion pathway protein D